MNNTKDKLQAFSDSDIIEHCALLVGNALISSRKANFKNIPFTYEQLEAIHKCLFLGINRTETLNKLLSSLQGRDSALVSSLQELELSLKPIETFKQSINNLLELSKFFINKD